MERQERQSWPQAPLGRLAIIFLLTLGLYYGLWQVIAGIHLLWGSPAQAMPKERTSGLAIQLVAVFCASLFGTIGERYGGIYGLAAAAWASLIFPLLDPWTGTDSGQAAFSGLLSSMGAGLCGGSIGSLWVLCDEARVQPNQGDKGYPGGSVLRGAPVRPIRILLGAGLSLAGIFWLEELLDALVALSQGSFNLFDVTQRRVVLAQVTGLSVLIGAFFAGAGTWRGVIQGLFHGASVALVLLLTQLQGKDLTLFEISNKPLVITPSVLILSALGGWLGHHLWPPTVAGQHCAR
ncbi:MAG: hypothetical protein C4297_02935 [Gemmataceae bacterium]